MQLNNNTNALYKSSLWLQNVNKRLLLLVVLASLLNIFAHSKLFGFQAARVSINICICTETAMPLLVGLQWWMKKGWGQATG